MDGHTGSQAHPPRERSRPPSYAPVGRASSRASNSTTSTRVTSHSGTASSHTAVSPQLATQRFHNSNTTNAQRPPQLKREGSGDPRQSAMSSYLQEKLQRERRVEAEKMAPSRMTPELSGSTELRAIQSSPIRASTSDGRRPISSGGGGGGGGGEQGKKKGMGVKEMEQTVSTLHKKNFDLKLELYHRRERQTALEERVEAIEREKKQVEDMNDELLEELQKRDKAVEEAVAMIVLLEAQVEKLVKENGILREAETRDFYRRIGQEMDAANRLSTPKLRASDLARLEEGKVINRMPSFLSMHSEHTENLRNVYLGSLTSLPRPGEGGSQSEVDNDRATALASPSLSVLSESSFLSVYGQNNGRDGATTPPFDDGLLMNNTYADVRPSAKSNGTGSVRERQPRDGVATPSRRRRSNSITHGTAPGQFQALENILDHGSPLQRLEKLDRTYSLKMERAESPRQTGQDREAETQQLSRTTRTLSQRKTKEEKREALRRVLTTDPTSRLHDHGLPPTPDTISTSTLRHYQNSNDTLSQKGVTSQRSYLALSETTVSTGAEKPYDDDDAAPNPVVPVSQPPSMTAFNSRKDVSGSSYFDSRIPFMQRPRSAGETTTSHRQGNAWDSDSEDDSDAHSLASSLDVWMRESRKPNRARVSGRVSGRASPDLFGFPTRTGAGTWATDAMLGPFSGSFRGQHSSISHLDGSPDDLMPVQAAILATGGPPPPPNRRSSLHARTGSTSASAMVNAAAQDHSPAQPRSQKPPSRRKAHARHNSDDIPTRSASQSSAPPPQTSDPRQGNGNRGKDSHYPPITGQQPRGRGLNRLFRRSLGSGGGSESAPGSATEPTFAAAASKTGSSSSSIGMPSWMHRSNTGDDERASATPPPIMRNRAASNMEDGDMGTPKPNGQGHAVPNAPAGPTDTATATTTTATPTATPTATTPCDGPTKRKWLPGFGRNSSTKNRAA